MKTQPTDTSRLLQRYGTGTIPFAGTEDALYDRHLVFDRAIDPKVASARERFEAVSHAVRDVLAQRWVKTKTTYEQQNAKRIYYLSMEFLLGRSLTNNITNLLQDWEMGVLAALRPASSTRWQRWNCLEQATVCGTSTACFDSRL